jgi:hypothetical protein
MASEFSNQPLSPKSYDINQPWLTLDPWQEKYINTTDKNCFLLCGRQSGKSAACSIKFGKLAATQKNRTILMIAFTENQAYQLFFKTLMYLRAVYPHMILGGNDKPTKHVIKLRNGSQILCYAAGLAGEGIRGFTLTNLVMDECAMMSQEVFVSCAPMISVTNGTMDLLSTPRGKQGFFYQCSLRDDFEKFYVSAEDCPRHSKQFLESQKSMMSTLEYASEYLAQFLDDFKRIFSDALIDKCCIGKREKTIDKFYKTYLGTDIARYGNDEGTFEIVKKIDSKQYRHIENIITKKKSLFETNQEIIRLNDLYDFKEIAIDAGSGSLGVGSLDFLLQVSNIKHKVVAINNRALSLDSNDQNKQKILKEDLYNNLVGMMERGEIILLDDDEVKASLASVQFEYVVKAGEPTKLHIWASYGHVVEGVIRALWVASKDKSLALWWR